MIHERIARMATFCLIVLVLACGTGGKPDLETEWMGHSYKDLQKSFGDPIMDMPESHLRLVVFAKMVPMQGPVDPIVYTESPATGDSLGVSMPQAYPTQVNKSQLYEQQYYFWLDPEGEVVRAEIHTP